MAGAPPPPRGTYRGTRATSSGVRRICRGAELTRSSAPANKSLVDQCKTVDVEQSEVGDLQVRDHRQRQERHLEERLRQRAAEIARGGAERDQRGAHLLKRLQAYQPRHR